LLRGAECEREREREGQPASQPGRQAASQPASQPACQQPGQQTSAGQPSQSTCQFCVGPDWLAPPGSWIPSIGLSNGVGGFSGGDNPAEPP